LSNIAEGFSRETDREFLRGLWISKASAAEVQSLSYTALDQGYIGEDLRKQIYDQAEKVGSLNSGMIKYLQRSFPHPKKRNDSKTQRLKNPKTP